jgi:hypothetical protein
MKVFEEIVDNICTIGLKKPITVAELPGDDGEPRYVLVCGEGRLNAFRILGETHIPALVVDVTDENGQLKGRQIIEAKRLIEKREAHGPSSPLPGRFKPPTSSYSLVRTYQKEVDRQRKMVLKAEHAHQRLLLVVQGLKTLFADEHFVNLLRAEQLDTLPKYLAEKIQFADMAYANSHSEQALEGVASRTSSTKQKIKQLIKQPIKQTTTRTSPASHLLRYWGLIWQPIKCPSMI